MKSGGGLEISAFAAADLGRTALLDPYGPSPRHAERWERQMAGEVDYLAADLDGDLVGHVLVVWSGSRDRPECPRIEDLLVAPDWRRRGVATALMGEAERRAKSRGCIRLALAVDPDPHCPARLFYQARGWRLAGGSRYIEGVFPLRDTETGRLGHVAQWAVDLIKDL